LENVTIRPAHPPDIPDVRAMLGQYVAWIGLDLAFQEIDEELAELPGDYAPPRGVLLVAVEGDHLIGMIGLRPLEGTACEMKRLFVRPTARGRGLARALVTRRLDTLPMMGPAQSLYASLGFHDIRPYYETPIAGTRFMAKKL
jgi:GNAT superfamily N-acetyltransferase